MIFVMDDSEILERAAQLPVGAVWDTGSETITVGPRCVVVEPEGLHDEAYELIRHPAGKPEVREHPS
jgi:hypothetical protein